MDRTMEQQNMMLQGFEDEDVIDLQELFFALLAGWKSILIFMLLGALLAGVYHQFFITATYQADAKLYITNTDSMISFSDLQLSAALTDDYADIIKSRTVLKHVIKELNLDMDYKQLQELVKVSNPDKTHIIHILVTCDDMEMARNIANALLNISIKQIYQIIKSGEPTVIDVSEVDSVQDMTPGLFKFLVIGAVLGAVLIGALIIVRELLDTTLQSEEEMEKYLQLPVLSVVPYYHEKERKGKE